MKLTSLKNNVLYTGKAEVKLAQKHRNFSVIPWVKAVIELSSQGPQIL